MSEYLEKHKEEIIKLCNTNDVKTLYVFGSVLTDNFNESSDIDFVVNINSNEPIDYAEKYFNLKFALEDLLKKSIDLLEEKTLKNKYLIKNIDRNKVRLYEREY